MGIQSLLPFLSNSTRDAQISEFENEFVAVDASCWLHKGIYCCGVEIAMKKPTTKYVTYCMRYIDMLLYFKVKPILVFDGKKLSSKKDTEKKRHEERKNKFKKGMELIKAGKVSEGRKLLGESVDVTHEMAVNLMKECRKRNIDCIVAPYEADAQLAYLSLNNIVKCIITEDSDLLVYGCERVMFKMDTSGRGRLIEKNLIHLSLDMAPEECTEEIFRYMCILSGCDYLPSLPSIGPANALKFVKMLKDKDINQALPKLPIYLNKLKAVVTPEYIEGFRIANNTFKHQVVYDPFKRKEIPLKPADDENDIVGEILAEDLAFQLAVGNIDPITMKKLDNYDPDEYGKGFSILWTQDHLPRAISRSSSLNEEQKLCDPKKRQREGVESDGVYFPNNDLKKQRLPPTFSNYKNIYTKKTVKSIPKTGFIFEPKEPEIKKNGLKKIDQSNSLLSRYFTSNRKQPVKKQPEKTSERRKDETNEEYLLRLYNECLSDQEDSDGQNSSQKENSISGDEISQNSSLNESKKLYKSNLKTSHSLLDEIYKSDTNLKTDSLIATNEVDNSPLKNSCQKENSFSGDKISLNSNLNETKKLYKTNLKTSHSLLDEICKSDTKLKCDSLIKTNEEDNSPVKNSFAEKLSVNLSNFLSKNDNLLDDTKKSQIDVPINKENVEIVDLEKEKEEETDRCPSPVFKIQKESKVVNSSSKFDKVSDTAATPTSVYFSATSNRSFQRSNSLISGKQTPLSTNRKLPSMRSFGSAPSKLGKPSSANRTLFQFGFKKKLKEDVEDEIKELPES